MAKELKPEWKIPTHIAIIMDGNGRWAKKRGLPRTMGHRQGGKTVETVCEEAYRLGISYLTLYAFSTENWKRPQEEIDTLMSLLRSYLKDCVKLAKKNRMRVRVLGDLTGLEEDIQKSIRMLERESAENDGLQFQIAINYGGRDEILRAMERLFSDYQKDPKSLKLSEEIFSSYLDTGGIPDPDLIIRTSKEQRLSNFLLWQSAYAELYFPEVLWPDFSRDDLIDAIAYYNTRERRFGGLTNVHGETGK